MPQVADDTHLRNLRGARGSCQRARLPRALNSGPREAAKTLRSALSPGPWHEEVGLGVVEDDERDGEDLDHSVPVQCDLSEDPRRCLFRPGLVEEEVADTVEDRLPLVHFEPLGPVGVATDYEVGS